MTVVAPGITVDLLDPDFYTDPYLAYAHMRQHHPVWWDPKSEMWGLFGYDQVVEVEKAKSIFINSDPAGGYRPKIGADPSIIGLDDPQHSVRRALVSRRFTQRAVSAWEPHIRAAVRNLIGQALAQPGPVEIVEALASPLPAMMIGHLLGFDEDMWPKLRDWSARTISLGGGPGAFNEDGIAAWAEFRQACTELYEARLHAPAQDDIMGIWLKAQVDGLKDQSPFGLEEILSDCLLLLDGGAETTRTVLGRALVELARRQDQWSLVASGADLDVAADELIRFVTPIHNMTRMAVESYEIADQLIEPGQQVMFMYASANRDLYYFDNPEQLDVTRDPNPHIAFGFGTHFCLGASLARLEIRIFFEELIGRVDGLELVGEPVPMKTAFVNGLTSAMISFNLRP